MVLIADQALTIVQHGAPCLYTMSTNTASYGFAAATSVVSVATGPACMWSVDNTNDWISILSTTNNIGDGNVTYAVDANRDTVARTGLVTIASQTFTINQDAGPCIYKISPTTRSHGSGMASNTVSITASNNCPWEVANTNGWISIASATSGVGPATISYVLDANLSLHNRTGTVVIADQVLTITQDALVCDYSLSPTNRVHDSSPGTNSVSLVTDAPCPWIILNTNTWISIASGTSGTGSATIAYTLEENSAILGRTGFVQIADRQLTIVQHGVSCEYTISSTNQTHGFRPATNAVILTAPSACSWFVVNTNDWITITSEIMGNGNGVIGYTLATNLSLAERTGVVQIADQALTIIQGAAPCEYTLSSSNRVHGFGPVTNSVSLTALSPCPWTIVNTNDWITITSTTAGNGSGTIGYELTSNLNLNERTGVVQIADQQLTIIQGAVVCSIPWRARTRCSTLEWPPDRYL